jgi:Ca2+-binding RTX toxin-like protein
LDFSALPADVPMTIRLVGSTQTTLADVHANRNLVLIPESFETVIGGAGNDSLTGSRFNNRLEGRGGNDTLTGGLGNDTLDGGLGINTLVEASTVAATSFTLTNTRLVGVGTDTLANVQIANLTGGTGIDTFTVSGWTGTGTMSGGSGGTSDKIVTNQFTLGPVTLHGGGGDDVLIGGSKNDSLDGGSGRDLLIGGQGVDDLLGGTDEDIVIGGTSSHSPISQSANVAALNAIMAEWTSGSEYTTRVNNLLAAGVGPSATKLNATTVQNDSDADSLKGSLPAPDNADLDWFFQSVNDVLDAIDGEIATPI